MRQGVVVSAARPMAVRRICPPPEPYSPSISIMERLNSSCDPGCLREAHKCEFKTNLLAESEQWNKGFLGEIVLGLGFL